MPIADSAASIHSLEQRIKSALEAVNAQITAACMQAERGVDEVTLLAVSKAQPTADIRYAYQAGQRHFGENYVQEALDKIHALTDLQDIIWHFIGPLQSNKSKDVAEHFDWLHSLERLKVARRLNQQRAHKPVPLQVLIQINIDDEDTKAGIELAQLSDFAKQVNALEHLSLRGLMAIPQATASAAERTASFARLATAFTSLQADYPNVDTLSLGMSGDLNTAIQHGSTMVRIGTAIFGQRKG